MPTSIIQPGCLLIADIKQYLDKHHTITIDEQARTNIQKSADIVSEIVASDQVVYGINTGFGALSNQTIHTNHLEELQHKIVMSHAAGVGTEAMQQVWHHLRSKEYQPS